MRILLVGLSLLVLSGCFGMGMEKWSPEQIKATNGMATCTTATTIYGKGSTATVNMDDVRKGATSQGKTTITCGDTTMAIDTNVGVGGTGAPPGAVVVTPMEITPMQVKPQQK